MKIINGFTFLLIFVSFCIQSVGPHFDSIQENCLRVYYLQFYYRQLFYLQLYGPPFCAVCVRFHDETGCYKLEISIWIDCCQQVEKKQTSIGNSLRSHSLFYGRPFFGHVCDFVMVNVVLNLNVYLEWLLPTIREKTNINLKFTKTSQLILWTTMFWTCLCDFVMRGCYKLESPIWIDCCQHLENNNWKFICACSSLFMDDHFRTCLCDFVMKHVAIQLTVLFVHEVAKNRWKLL